MKCFNGELKRNVCDIKNKTKVIKSTNLMFLKQLHWKQTVIVKNVPVKTATSTAKILNGLSNIRIMGHYKVERFYTHSDGLGHFIFQLQFKYILCRFTS